MADFEVVGRVTDVETIAVNLSIREHAELKAQYGGRRWRKLKGVATVRLVNGSLRRAEIRWYSARRREAQVEDQKILGLNQMESSMNRFLTCVSNDGCDDLTAWKLYRVLPDENAAEERYLRIVDDSGDDYLYPAQRFVEVDIPAAAQRALFAAKQIA